MTRVNRRWRHEFGRKRIESGTKSIAHQMALRTPVLGQSADFRLHRSAPLRTGRRAIRVFGQRRPFIDRGLLLPNRHRSGSHRRLHRIVLLMRSTVPRELYGQRSSAGRRRLLTIGRCDGLTMDDGPVGRRIGTGVASSHVQDAGLLRNAALGDVRFDQNIVVGPSKADDR